MASPQGGGPPVTVAVVSWNTRALLSRCLESLCPAVDSGLADVWVVDNGSRDGSPDLVRDEAPWATLVEPGENLGFGAAVDLVAQHSTGRWIACANADIELTPGALDALLATGEEKAAGLVAPRLVLPDDSTQHSLHPFPSLGFTLGFNLGLQRLSGRLASRWCLEGHVDPSRPRPVPWAVGAFLLVRRDAFARVGGFDAEQWMYAEDLDLCWRLARAGYGRRYEPRAVVRHSESAATTPAFGEDKRERYMTATYQVIRRRRGIVVMLVTGLLNIAGAAARGRGEPREWRRAHVAALRTALRARLVSRA